MLSRLTVCQKVSLWVAALVLPVKATDAGGSTLLVATTLLQFIGTVFGDRIDVRGDKL